MQKAGLSIFIFWLLCTLLKAQSLPLNRRSDWQNAGRPTPIPEYQQMVNIQDFGGSGDGISLNEIPFQQALSALAGKPGVIFFPEGQYLFHTSIALRDSLILRGEGAGKTTLVFDLGSVQQNCIVSRGVLTPDINAHLLTENATQGDTTLMVNAELDPGDLVRFQFEDSLIVFSDWARGSAGQILEIIETSSNHIRLNHPLRISADLALRPRLRPINPVDDAGIECLKIKRLDPNVPIGSNILFEHSRRCWLLGVESEDCNFAHFCFDGSTQCEIYGCYAHEAFAYGGGGQAYGLVFQSTAGDNRAQNNIFEHLRHSMLMQSGANSNVLGYNFSTDPTWEEFPNDGAGEIVLHGNYPSFNLFEGNICENIRPDGSHGNNGPYNTLFRNRTTGYGLIVTGAEYQHALNVLGNEIIPAGLFQGLYLMGGADNLEQGNSQNAQIIPAGSPVQTDTSLYFKHLPAFLHGANFLIGPPSTFNTASIPAKDRFYSGQEKTDCEGRSGLLVSNFEPEHSVFTFDLFPNPTQHAFLVNLDHEAQVNVYDLSNKPWFATQEPAKNLQINAERWPAGMYVVQVIYQGKIQAKILIKTP